MDKWTDLRFSPACPLIHRPDYGYGDDPLGKVSFEATIGASVRFSMLLLSDYDRLAPVGMSRTD
jgi:hypothetical protein